MTTILDNPTTALATEDCDQRVCLHGVDWRGYCRLLQIRGDRSAPRMIYLDGSVEFVSPSYPHEFAKKRIARLVETIAEELDIAYIPTASTTFRRRGKRGGVEGDESYYFQNAGRLKGKKTINLRVDPPPDLAIEVVHAHGAERAIEVYRRLGVPEVWVWESGALLILAVHPGVRYSESATSVALPFLSSEEITRWVGRPLDVSEARWSRDLRQWVREVLLPRYAGGSENPTVE